MEKYFKSLTVVGVGIVSAVVGNLTYESLNRTDKEDSKQLVRFKDYSVSVSSLVTCISGVFGLVGSYFTVDGSTYALLHKALESPSERNE